ncbi:hypothetical protein SESBI_30137 [Sesbania bispinosa]|nr:hypothetical protein SESBI_30137 [Sesbania bispinosa]
MAHRQLQLTQGQILHPLSHGSDLPVTFTEKDATIHMCTWSARKGEGVVKNEDKGMAISRTGAGGMEKMMGECGKLRSNGVETDFQTHLAVGRIDASHHSEPQLCMPADCVHVKH